MFANPQTKQVGGDCKWAILCYSIIYPIRDDDEFFLQYRWLTTAFAIISSQDHCQGSSTSRISDMLHMDLNLCRSWVQVLLNEVLQ